MPHSPAGSVVWLFNTVALLGNLLVHYTPCLQICPLRGSSLKFKFRLSPSWRMHDFYSLLYFTVSLKVQDEKYVRQGEIRLF